ncbi:hypothetical protein [Bordetella genomosp. 13]|uniref:Uncharacterized protein n=1 Tax=Bordetella genomosp. 13 TaxID=463040 RepID=A0A1W6Z7A5_9BORD|nr:hypothetical protein [Bordetella genomosp. 13]ARP93306.1 hypothetical protein CAL15_02225 [Bordetella genomosp. 13]
MTARAAPRVSRRALAGLVLLASLASGALYTSTLELGRELNAQRMVRCMVQNLTRHDIRYALPGQEDIDLESPLHWDYVSRGNRRDLQLPSLCIVAPPSDGADLTIAWSRYAPDLAPGSMRLYVASFPGLRRPDDVTGLAVRLYPGGKAAARYVEAGADVDVTSGLLAEAVPAGWTPGLSIGAPSPAPEP